MKKTLLISMLIALSFIRSMNAVASSWSVVDVLNSKNPEKVDSQLKVLGFERGVAGFSKVQILLPHVSGSNNALCLLAVSWEGPYEGYLALIDSGGKVIGRARVGYVKSICLRALRESGDDVVLVDAIRGTGSGVREDRFNIFTISPKRLGEVWNDLSYYKSFPLGMAPEDNYEILGAMSFEDINNDGIYELIYTAKKIKYLYDIKSKKLSRDGVSKVSTKLFKLADGHYKFWKEIKND